MTSHRLNKARLARSEGRLDDALMEYTQMVSECRQSQATEPLIHALNGQAQIERDLGRRDTAVVLYEEAVTCCRDLDVPMLLAHTLRHLGEVHMENGELESAESRLTEALTLVRSQMGDAPLALANAVRPLALLRERQGLTAEATRLWDEAKHLYSRSDCQPGVDESDQALARLNG